MEQNRVLTLEEVLGLPEGAVVWVEMNQNMGWFDSSQTHTVTHNYRKPEYCKHALVDAHDRIWSIFTDKSETYFGAKYRVWFRKPTRKEKAANPWAQ